MKLPKSKTSRFRRRPNQSSIRYAVEEMKFLKSLNDFRIFWRKIGFLLPRIIGTFDSFFKVPPSMQLEPTNFCNADCICCPSSRSSRKRGYMEIGLFKRIIDDASQIGVKLVFLFLHGEPMLHPQIIEMIRYLKLKGLAVHLTTNGTLLNKDKIEALLASGVNSADYVSFSILGASKDVHERIVRRANYDRVIENLNLLLDLRRERGTNGPVVEAVFYRMLENEHEEQEFVRKWQGVVDHVRLGGDISQSFSEYKRNEEPLKARTHTCKNLWQKMTIFWNGDVSICCEDVDGDWVIGNLNKQSLSEIWNSKEIVAIKKMHKKREFETIPLCFKCDMW